MSDDAPLRRLPLHEEHVHLGARMAPFAGWDMPLQYEGIVAEHEAVRGRAGLFDVSHMGRVTVEGPDAGARLRSVTTFDVRRLGVGEAHYSLYCTESGGIADDIFVYHVAAERWVVVHNAANAASDFARLSAVAPDARDVTTETVMLALQGPEALDVARAVLDAPALGELPPRHCLELPWNEAIVLVSRTGYTGEDGVECILPPEPGRALWAALIDAGVRPAGLGARDTLRLEASLVLHGHDIEETTNPYEAGLGWTVTLDDGDGFVGRNELARLRDEPPRRRLSQVRLRERAVPRAGYEVVVPEHGVESVATLTSGTFGPTLRAGICMAYLPVEYARTGTSLAVLIRDRAVPAEVVRRPFYRARRG